MTSRPSRASTSKSSRRPSTAVSVAVAVTLRPTGVGGDVLDLEAHAEAFLPAGELGLDAVDGGRLHEGDHDGAGQHGRAAAADMGRGVLLAHDERGEPVSLTWSVTVASQPAAIARPLGHGMRQDATCRWPQSMCAGHDGGAAVPRP